MRKNIRFVPLLLALFVLFSQTPTAFAGQKYYALQFSFELPEDFEELSGEEYLDFYNNVEAPVEQYAYNLFSRTDNDGNATGVEIFFIDMPKDEYSSSLASVFYQYCIEYFKTTYNDYYDFKESDFAVNNYLGKKMFSSMIIDGQVLHVLAVMLYVPGTLIVFGISSTETRDEAEDVANTIANTLQIVDSSKNNLFFSTDKGLQKSKSSSLKKEVAHPQMPNKSVMTKAYCEKVVDGDTAWFQYYDDKITHKVRFIGIDTPEIHHPTKGVEFYGPEASAFTEKNLSDKIVYLEYDKEKLDKYDRQLCYIWLEDGTLFNLTLLEYGYAKIMTIRPNTKYLDFFTEAENKAQEHQRGIWQNYK